MEFGSYLTISKRDRAQSTITVLLLLPSFTKTCLANDERDTSTDTSRTLVCRGASFEMVDLKIRNKLISYRRADEWWKMNIL